MPCGARLEKLDARNAQGELYLTDAVRTSSTSGGRAAALRTDDAQQAIGINNRVELRLRRARCAIGSTSGTC